MELSASRWLFFAFLIPNTSIYLPKCFDHIITWQIAIQERAWSSVLWENSGKWCRSQASELSHWRDNGVMIFKHQIPGTGWGKLRGQFPGSPDLPRAPDRAAFLHWRNPHTDTSRYSPLEVGFHTLMWPQDVCRAPKMSATVHRESSRGWGQQWRQGPKFEGSWISFFGALFCIEGTALEDFR